MKELLTKKDVVRDYSIAGRTLNRLIRTRTIPHIKIGKLVRFLPSDLEKFIQSRRIEPTNLLHS